MESIKYCHTLIPTNSVRGVTTSNCICIFTDQTQNEV